MIELPTTPGGFKVCLADPAWTFVSRSNTNQDRRPQDHYTCMTIDELCDMPVRDVMAPDSWLFGWVTGPHHILAQRVYESWGFVRSGYGLTWAKLREGMTPEKLALMLEVGGFRALNRAFHMGMGYTSRANVEICELWRRGKPKIKSHNVRELIVAPVREHSRKPAEAYERIEALADGPYLELFARNSSRPGWVCWGNDVEKFQGE